MDKFEKCKNKVRTIESENKILKEIVKVFRKFVPFDYVIVFKTLASEYIIIGANANEVIIFDIPTGRTRKFKDDLDNLYNEVLNLIDEFEPIEIYLSLNFPLTSKFENEIKKRTSLKFLPFF